ncbi:MAG: SET domain-containing protein [Patescibacteria group bacterium]
MRSLFQPTYARCTTNKRPTQLNRGSYRSLFAKHPLKKGEPIFKVEGPTVRYQFPPDYRLGYQWFNTGKNTWIIPQRNNPWWFIKHSCQPNVGVVRKNVVVALREIGPDEELTIDDAITETDPRWKRQCQCGAKNCRGLIRSVQFLPQELFETYRVYMPAFQRNMYLAWRKSIFR